MHAFLSLLLATACSLAGAKVIFYHPFEEATPPFILTGLNNEEPDIALRDGPNGYLGAPCQVVSPPTELFGTVLSCGNSSFHNGYFDAGQIMLDVPKLLSIGEQLRVPNDVARGLGTPVNFEAAKLSISVWVKFLNAPNWGKGKRHVLAPRAAPPVVLEKDGEFMFSLNLGSSSAGQTVKCCSYIVDVGPARVAGDHYDIIESNPNEWHHYVITYSNKKVSLFHNGAFLDVETSPFIEGYSSTFSKMVVGNAASSQPTRGFPGYIDELVIFDEVLDNRDIELLFRDSFIEQQNLTLTSTAQGSGIDPDGYPIYEVSVAQEHLLSTVASDSANTRTWAYLTTSSCDNIVENFAELDDNKTVEITAVEQGTFRVELQIEFDFVVGQTITYFTYAMVTVLPTPPVIQGDLPSLVDVAENGSLSLFFDVLMSPAGVISWQFLAGNSTNSTNSSSRRLWYETDVGRMLHRQNNNDTEIWGNIAGAIGSVLSLNWTDLQDFSNDLVGGDLNDTVEIILRAVASNSEGSVTSQRVTVSFVHSPASDGGGSDENDGGSSNSLSTYLGIGTGAAAGACILLLCCLVAVVICTAILAIAAFASFATAFSRRTIQKHSKSVTDLMDAELKEIWNVPFDELEMGECLGSGAFGAVNVGSWRGTDVAIKQLHLKGEQVDAFLAEADVMRELRPHPNVVQLYGVCTEPDSPMCIVMEYLPMGDLLGYLKRTGPVSAELGCSMAYDIAAGMSHLAKEGIVHRDLAARNLLLTETLHVKVADFGMSQIRSEGSGDGAASNFGPLRWMSPEVLQKQKPWSESSDVFSYAITLFEIFSGGEQPYAGLSPVEAAIAVCKRDLRPDIPSATPPPVEELIQSCWAKDPSKRPTFAEVTKVMKKVGMVKGARSRAPTAQTAAGAYGALTLDSDGYGAMSEATAERYTAIDTNSGLDEYKPMSIDEYQMPMSAFEDMSSEYGAM